MDDMHEPAHRREKPPAAASRAKWAIAAFFLFAGHRAATPEFVPRLGGGRPAGIA